MNRYMIFDNDFQRKARRLTCCEISFFNIALKRKWQICPSKSLKKFYISCILMRVRLDNGPLAPRSGRNGIILNFKLSCKHLPTFRFPSRFKTVFLPFIIAYIILYSLKDCRLHALSTLCPTFPTIIQIIIIYNSANNLGKEGINKSVKKRIKSLRIQEV